MFPENDKLSKAENALNLEITGLTDNSSVFDYLKCLAACEFNVCGEKVHAFLLQRASGTRTFVWGWDIRVPVNDLAENLTSLDDALTVGLSNIPHYLNWDIHLDGEATSHEPTQSNKNTLPPPR